MTKQIKALGRVAQMAGDDAMVAMCYQARGHELLDSETNESLDADDLGITTTRYVELVCESLDSRQAEGHVRCGERRVYAMLVR